VVRGDHGAPRHRGLSVRRACSRIAVNENLNGSEGAPPGSAPRLVRGRRCDDPDRRARQPYPPEPLAHCRFYLLAADSATRTGVSKVDPSITAKAQSPTVTPATKPGATGQIRCPPLRRRQPQRKSPPLATPWGAASRPAQGREGRHAVTGEPVEPALVGVGCIGPLLPRQRERSRGRARLHRRSSRVPRAQSGTETFDHQMPGIRRFVCAW
jgi:hypothetical protein